MQKTVSSISFKRYTNEDGTLKDCAIFFDGAEIFRGTEAPLLVYGMKKFSEFCGLAISFSESYQQDTQRDTNSGKKLTFLHVVISGQDLIYSDGDLLYSGENAIESFNKYLRNLQDSGIEFTTKKFSYTQEDAPKKYLRDLE